MAFQDGRTAFSQLEEFTLINKELAEKHNIEPRANIETFERGMPIDFLPIDRRNLKFKMSIASKAQMKKLITFVFTHFLSLNPMYPSAHNLFKRHKEFIQIISICFSLIFCTLPRFRFDHTQTHSPF